MSTEQTMSEQEQRIVIAEACGWRKFPHVVINGKRYDKETWVSPTFAATFNPDCPHAGAYAGLNGMPDYLGDLNAIAEAERMLTAAQIRDYIEHVRYICGMEMDADIAVTGYPMFATAKQRSEALLKTLNLWPTP